MTDLTNELVYANLKIKYKIQGEFVMNLILMKILLALGILSHSHIFGSVAFAAITFFITIGTAHHVKFALAEYVFVKLGRDEKAKSLMIDLYTSSPVTRLCYIGYIIFIVTLIVSIVTGVAAFPVWAVIFTILPVFILLFPFRIIGTLHISAMVSMAAWIFLI